MTTDQLYAFAFRGVLAHEALENTDALPRLRLSEHLEDNVAARLSLAILDEDLLAHSRRMAVVYAAIATFENQVRKFVSRTLLEKVGEDWWEHAIPEGIRKKAESRQLEEEKIRWHTARGDEPLNYTDFGELISIIVQSTNWVHFQPHLQQQEWVKQILKTLERSRNVITHSGELANEDIERIGSSIRDWVKQVGS